MESSESDPYGNENERRLAEAIEVLTALQFGPRQRNPVAAYTLLALLDLTPSKPWSEAESPLRGITPIIDFIAGSYGVRYAPNTRETVRDEVVKFFVETGLLLRNPDRPDRPTNSGKTVYQVEPTALALLRKFRTPKWAKALKAYLVKVEEVKREIARHRELVRVPVTLPDGQKVALSPGGQNPQTSQGTQRTLFRLHGRACFRDRLQHTSLDAIVSFSNRMGIRSLDRRRPGPHDPFQWRQVSWTISRRSMLKQTKSKDS